MRVVCDGATLMREMVRDVDAVRGDRRSMLLDVDDARTMRDGDGSALLDGVVCGHAAEPRYYRDKEEPGGPRDRTC